MLTGTHPLMLINGKYIFFSILKEICQICLVGGYFS